MTAAVAPERTGPALRDRLGLAVLVALLAACAWLLHLIGGWPHLPAGLPSWRTLTITLQGSYVPDQAAVYLITTLGWLVWLWLTLSMLVHGLVVVAERLRPGGCWLVALRAVSTRVTLPIVRRTVEAALVATFLLNVGTRAPMVLAASPSAVAAAVAPSAASSSQATSPEPDSAPADVEYIVQPADTLWAIASRFYGSGTDYPRLVAANTGRAMPHGHTFTNAGVIQPGWKLRIPLPSAAIDESGGQVRYLVQSGDTLGDIAARMLGSEDRWQELYAANRNVARLPDGRVLTSPDLIWPGLPLSLPLAQQAPPAPPPQPAVVVEVPSPAAVPASASAAPSASVAPEPAPVEQPAPIPEIAPAPRAAGRPPLTLLYGFAGSAAAAGAGAATVLVRRRRARRSLQEPLPADDDAPAVVDGFAEAELSRGLTHRLDGDELEPALVVAGQVGRFLTDHDLPNVAILAVRYGSSSAAVLLEASLSEQRQMATLVPELERLFHCSTRLQPTVDHDVLLTLGGLRLASLVGLGWQPVASPLLVPVALLPERETLYVDWLRAGPALLAGSSGGDVETVFVSLVAALAARRSPDQLRLLLIGSPYTLPRPLAELPHLPRAVVEQANGDEVLGVLRDLKRELTERTPAEAHGWRAGQPLMVLAIADLADLDEAARLAIEALLVDGPQRGILVLAATGRPDRLPEALLSDFSTKVVLRTISEEQSQRLLGLTEAADLGGGGDLYVRVHRRSPVRGRGFAVSAEHLEELRRLMAGAYGNRPPEVERAEAPEAPVFETSDSAARDTEEPPPETLPTDATPEPPAQAPGPLPVTEDVRIMGEPGKLADAPEPAAGPLAIEEEVRLLDDATSWLAADGLDEEQPLLELDDVEEFDDLEQLDQSDETDDLGEVDEGEAAALAAPKVATSPERPTAQRVADVEAQIAARMAGARAASARATVSASPAAGTVLDIRCFGGFSVLYQGRPVTPKSGAIRHHKPWEILALLAAQPAGTLATDKVLLLMWPEVGTEDATNRLYQNMFRLRETLSDQVPGIGTDVVRAERPGFCRLSTEVASSDVQRFVALLHQTGESDRQAAKAAARQARELYHGDLLAGMPYPWLHERLDDGTSLQERYRQDYSAVTGELARLCAEDQEHEQAAELYKELLRAEPLLEDVLRNLYCCYAALGDRASLVQQHRHLEQALRDMFDGNPALAQPQPETVAAYRAALARVSGQPAEKADLRASA